MKKFIVIAVLAILVVGQWITEDNQQQKYVSSGPVISEDNSDQKNIQKPGSQEATTQNQQNQQNGGNPFQRNNDRQNKKPEKNAIIAKDNGELDFQKMREQRIGEFQNKRRRNGNRPSFPMKEKRRPQQQEDDQEEYFDFKQLMNSKLTFLLVLCLAAFIIVRICTRKSKQNKRAMKRLQKQNKQRMVEQQIPQTISISDASIDAEIGFHEREIQKLRQQNMIQMQNYQQVQRGQPIYEYPGIKVETYHY